MGLWRDKKEERKKKSNTLECVRGAPGQSSTWKRRATRPNCVLKDNLHLWSWNGSSLLLVIDKLFQPSWPDVYQTIYNLAPGILCLHHKYVFSEWQLSVLIKKNKTKKKAPTVSPWDKFSRFNHICKFIKPAYLDFFTVSTWSLPLCFLACYRHPSINKIVQNNTALMQMQTKTRHGPCRPGLERLRFLSYRLLWHTWSGIMFIM